MKTLWREDKSQKAWLWIGLLFLAFYFLEALLFWGPTPRITAPPYTPLVFWGLFGSGVIVIVSRFSTGSTTSRIETIQAWVLGTVITLGAVGSAFLVIARTRDVTLGHAILLIVLGVSGVVVGSLSYSIGWVVAGIVWLIGVVSVLLWPSYQDYTLGAVVALGFILIGALRMRLIVLEKS